MVSPSTKAKPRTPPVESRYSTTAAMMLTVSEARMVRLARSQPWSTAAAIPRPSRISSRTRSK